MDAGYSGGARRIAVAVVRPGGEQKHGGGGAMLCGDFGSGLGGWGRARGWFGGRLIQRCATRSVKSTARIAASRFASQKLLLSN